MNKQVKEALRVVVGSQMLAPTLKQLAEWLNYPSRSTLYRIVDGTAGDTAVRGVLSRIEDVMGYGVALLEEMAEIIGLGEEIRKCAGAGGRRRAMAVVKGIIEGRFEVLSEGTHEALLYLRRMEEERRAIFYNALSYYYLTESRARVYGPLEEFAKRSVKIFREIDDEISDMCPENDAGYNALLIFEEEDYFEHTMPLMHTLLDPLATVFRLYAHPGDIFQGMEVDWLLPGLGELTFWRTVGERPELILMQTIAGPAPGNGSYRLFHVRGEGANDLEFIGMMAFMEGNTASIRIMQRNILRMGGYSYDGEELRFDWGEGEDPLGWGLRWQRRDPAMSQTLRQLLRGITEERLGLIYLHAAGAMPVKEAAIQDVVLTQKELRLELTDGRRFRLPLEAFPFLETLTPREPVQLVRLRENGIVCAFWPHYLMTIPLERFDEV